MNRPYKIIHKYKNNRENIQYQIYIFLGPLVSKKVKVLLQKIKEMNLFDALMKLDKNELEILESNYGYNWYESFYTSRHIDYIKQDVLNTRKKQDIVKKFSTQWYDNHFGNYQKKRIKSNYNYAKLIKKNTQVKSLDQEGDEVIDFRVDKTSMVGGSVVQPEATNDLDELIDFEDFENIIQDGDNVDTKELQKVQKEIDKALDLKHQQTNKKTDSFDQSKDDIMYKEELKTVFSKHYVYDNYIYPEDTVKNMKNKICMSLPQNHKFKRESNDVHILPSRQYIWSEYDYFDNKEVLSDKIMIGQKWIRKSELLLIEVEPNTNLSIYENLNNNLFYLKESIKKTSSKIRLEREDIHKCLYDYEPFNRYREFYMIDLYNDLGLNYNTTPEKLDNLFKVYTRIYYPLVSFEELKSVVQFLNHESSDYKIENTRNQNVAQFIRQELVTENAIIQHVETAKLEKNINTYFGESTNVLQSTIHVKLNVEMLNLYRIMDNFIVSSEYPLVQYMNENNQIVFKFFSKSQKYNQKHLSKKWFDNEQLGLNFKIKIGMDRYINVKLTLRGNIEYKTSMKEEENVSLQKVSESYSLIKDLVKKINAENKNQYIPIPLDSEFTFAYINTIEKFTLPPKKLIRHNDLSDFVRYFYPYITIVIDPRKRENKNKVESKISKFGTYFRYRRISHYENDSRIENKIRYFLKNFEVSDKQLAFELSKIFNLNEKQALKEITDFKSKYPRIKKSRKTLKKIENAPKYKPPGIEIAVQGKTPDKYKIRVTGVRNKPMLERIVDFYKVLIYLYIDTYIHKNPKRQHFLKTLKTLTNVAKRRHRVIEMLNVDESSISSIKTMGKIDKSLFGFKPGKNQNQYSRSCQNSGTMNRRPTIYTTEEDLVKDGYEFNTQTKQYERKVSIHDGKKSTEHVLAAVTLDGFDYYVACSPEVNKEYFFVDFLSKSHNPSKRCMPCCYKKNPLLSDNIKRVNYYKKCVGLDTMVSNDNDTDVLYILQDTIKLPPKRFGTLPRVIDIFFNKQHGLEYTLKNLNLHKTKIHFFKYGISQTNPYFSAISECFDIPVETIKDNIRNLFKGNIRNNSFSKIPPRQISSHLFTYLSNGNIRNRYNTVENYFEYVLINENVDYLEVFDLLNLPGVVSKDGINCLMLKKIVNKSKKSTDADFVIECSNMENSTRYHDPTIPTIIVINDDGFYYILCRVVKESDLKVQKVFYNKKSMNSKDLSSKDPPLTDYEPIPQLLQYFEFNCLQKSPITEASQGLKAKNVYQMINISKDVSPQYSVVFQYVDIMNLVYFLELANGLLIPTKPSGSILNVPIKESIEPKLTYSDTMESLMKFNKLNIFSIIPAGILIKGKPYREITDNEIMNITHILTNDDMVIPVMNKNLKKSSFKQMMKKFPKVYITNQSSYRYEAIDNEIIKGDDNVIVDERIINVNKNIWIEESYALFRLELSEVISKHARIKESIRHILANKGMSDMEMTHSVKKILYKICNSFLYQNFKKLTKDMNDIKLPTLNFINIMNDETFQNMDFTNYVLKNHRSTCDSNVTKDTCSSNMHCRYYRNECKFTATYSMLIKFISKATNELVQKNVAAHELLKESMYSVSDVINTNKFTIRENQKIIESGNDSKNKLLETVFGDDKPIIGKRIVKNNQDMVLEGMIKKGEYSSQLIINDQDTIFKAYANSYYWLMNPNYSLENRNLGFISKLQIEFGNFLKKQFIEYCNPAKKNLQTIFTKLKKHYDIEYNKFLHLIKYKIMNQKTKKNYLAELLVLNAIYPIPIIVYNDYDTIILIIMDDIIYDKKKNVGKLSNKTIEKIVSEKHKCINIKFEFQFNQETPVMVHSMYF